MKIVNWVKQLLYVVKHFDIIVDSMNELGRDHVRVKAHVDEAVQTIRDRTTLHADAQYMGGRHAMNQIIMIGRYHNRDYIQMFEVPEHDFSGMVRHCIEMQKYARTGRVDSAYPEMRQIINTEAENCWGTK